jgi:hypothetical protein
MNNRDVHTDEFQKHCLLSVDCQSISQAGIHYAPATMRCACGDNCGWRLTLGGFERIEFQPHIRK